MHNAAREMVFVAEQGVMADKNRLDPTWQEMLNHATCKVSGWCQQVPFTGSSIAFAISLSSYLLSFHHSHSSAFFFFFLMVLGLDLRGLVLARQAHYCSSLSTRTFLCWIF
jgi:hypothetical protein